MQTVLIKNIPVGNKHPLIFIAGPCVIESREMAMEVAETLFSLAEKLNVPFIFKTSFDKANRSSVHSFRGPGLKEGLKILGEIRERWEMPILTDFHTPEQAEQVASVADILQIPAFLCRQTDMLLAAAETGKVVNIKKGQFVAPWDMKNAIEKVKEAGNNRILITERGTSFGYNNLVADFRSIPIIQGFGQPVVFDATHSAQLPGGEGDRTGGMREVIPHLARAGVAAGADGIFMEIHPDPENAKSDASTQWSLKETENLWKSLLDISKIIRRNIEPS